MKTKKDLPDSCEKCNSKRIKISQHYNDYYFCKDCKDGGPLIKKDLGVERLLKEFERMLNEN